MQKLTLLIVLVLFSFSIAADPVQSSSSTAAEIMIFGGTHLRQNDKRFSDQEIMEVNKSLASWQPDIIVLEWLPADWPAGFGRDYRNLADAKTLMRIWHIDVKKVAADLEAQLAMPIEKRDFILVGKLFYAQSDQLNAAYYWWMAEQMGANVADLAPLTRNNLNGSEKAVHGFTIAQQLQHEQVYAFDYQGDDSAWIMDQAYKEVKNEGTAEDLAQMKAIDEETKAVNRFYKEAAKGNMAGLYRKLNSQEWMDLQKWSMHEVKPKIRFRAFGLRLTANLELRNARMFEYLEQSIKRSNAKRALVIVGAGHKYFLDKRVTEFGYKWVDTNDYLPPEGTAKLTR